MAEVTLNTQIITVLDEANSLWTPCVGPNNSGGTTFQALLGRLQALYPTASWDYSLLIDTLTTGKRRGRYKELPEGTYYLNQKMAQVNRANEVYWSVSSHICGQRICDKIARPIV